MALNRRVFAPACAVLLAASCGGTPQTNGEKDHARFLAKAASALGESHRDYLDYRDAAASLDKACQAAAGQTEMPGGQIEIAPDSQSRYLSAKKSLYEELARQQKSALIPLRLEARCEISQGKARAIVEAFYEEPPPSAEKEAKE